MLKTPPETKSTELRLFLHQEIELRALETHELILSIGGVGSGKTTSLVLWLLWLMQRRDTAQMHALFALTTTGLRAISRIIDKQLDRVAAVRNQERTISTRPPKPWLADWERRGIQTPPRQDRYENVRIWPCGLHLQMGTVHNKSYEQYRGAEWGTLAMEEVGLQGFTREAFDFLDERVRCGESGNGINCADALGHRHVKLIHSNPPESPDHWSWDLLEDLERNASERPGATKRNDGDQGYPNLVAGIGPALLIPSRTADNVRLPPSYIASKLDRLDSETAARRLGGVLTRTKVGRAYASFSHLNESMMFDYDSDRTLYVALDFNINPAVATFHHPLRPGEYPSEHERAGIQHIGTFGTFFHVGGINADRLCAMLLSGERGSQSNLPDSFLGIQRHKAGVMFFGDATAMYERMAGNEWQIVDRICGRALGDRYSRNVDAKRNPEVVLGVSAVNSKCCSMSGIRSYWMHPRNGELRQDFLTNVWDKRGTGIQSYGFRPGSGDKRFQRGHAADTVRYLITRLFPLGAEDSERGMRASEVLSAGPPKRRRTPYPNV